MSGSGRTRDGRGRKPTPARPTPARDAAPGGGARAAAGGPTPVREVLKPSAREPEPAPVEPTPVRRFTDQGTEWLARVSGEGAVGTGLLGGAPLVAVDFSRPEQPERPLRRTLLPRGRLFHLFDAELRALLARADVLERTDPA